MLQIQLVNPARNDRKLQPESINYYFKTNKF